MIILLDADIPTDELVEYVPHGEIILFGLSQRPVNELNFNWFGQLASRTFCWFKH